MREGEPKIDETESISGELGGGEKEAKWAEKIKELDGVVDALGHPIDKDIKETVAALNLLEIPTSASCEGHADSGFNAPWVEVSATGEPDEEYVGQEEVMQRVADERGIPFEEVKRMINFEAWREAFMEYSKHKLTPEYHEWQKKNRELKKLVARGLKEFYKNRKPVSSASRLRISRGSDFFRIEPEGVKDDWIDPKKRKKFSADRKRRAKKRLSVYRQEVKALTEFLKKEYYYKE